MTTMTKRLTMPFALGFHDSNWLLLGNPSDSQSHTSQQQLRHLAEAARSTNPTPGLRPELGQSSAPVLSVSLCSGVGLM